MATLQTGDFSLRALPQAPRVNPANFDAGIGELLSIFDSAMQMPARLENVRSVQRQGRLERATEPQRLELATAQANQALELLPYETAVKKRAAVTKEPGGQNLYYDAQGNLVQDTITIETDPVTGEQFNVTVPNVVKTAQQVQLETENAKSLAAIRDANAKASLERAGAATTNAEALAAYRSAQAEALRKGGKGRTVTVPIPSKFGRPAGQMEIQYDASGKTVRRTYIPAVTTDPLTGRPNNPEPVDLPLDDDALQDGTVQPQESVPTASVTSPATTTPPAVQSPDIAALAARYPTPQSLLADIRAGKITTAQGREIARANKFE
jgi:hypothetical protein